MPFTHLMAIVNRAKRPRPSAIRQKGITQRCISSRTSQIQSSVAPANQRVTVITPPSTITKHWVQRDRSLATDSNNAHLKSTTKPVQPRDPRANTPNRTQMAANNNWRATIPQDRQYMDAVASQNLFYGTAWKGEDTADLVYSAIKAGFRSIATAAQPKHYREDLVGEGVRRAILENIVTRNDLYIQTTFTPFHSQDPDNCPYDARLGIAQQVHASIKTSRQYFADPLTNRPGYLDAVILHDLYPFVDETVTAWESMTRHLGQAGGVARLGLSNVDKLNLERVCALHEHHLNTYARPVVVQNRFHQGNDYDAEIRALCKENRITYQAYGVRANSNMLNHGSSIVLIADMANVSREAALYGMVMNALGCLAEDKVSLDVQVVNGTRNRTRLAILKQVRQVLMDLNDAHWWNVTRLEQRRDSAADREQGGELTGGVPEKKQPEGIRACPSVEASLGARLGGGAYRLARHKFLEGLRSED